jgi:hypothetical protein
MRIPRLEYPPPPPLPPGCTLDVLQPGMRHKNSSKNGKEAAMGYSRVNDRVHGERWNSRTHNFGHRIVNPVAMMFKFLRP